MLYSKQFVFQNGHSTDNTIVQLVDRINEFFKNNKYTHGVFIDLLKAFSTIGNSILLKTLEQYGITDKNHGWVKSYLSNKKKFIQINEKGKVSSETISCGVLQGSILVPLLFLLHLNDLKNASKILDPMMVTNDSNKFFTHQDIRYLLQIINQELENIHQPMVYFK